MRSGVVEITHVLLGQTSSMTFAQNEDVIEEFTPDTAHEALTYRIGFGRIGRRVNERDPGSIHGMIEQRTVLVIVIANQETWTFSKGRRLPDLLGHPGITGGSGDIDMDDSS